jgi:hypothetical protein
MGIALPKSELVDEPRSVDPKSSAPAPDTIDAEIDALRKILHALVSLDDKGRKRALRWAADRFGV